MNNNKFSPFEFAEFDLIVADFENIDDLHKAIKYGVIVFDHNINDYVNSIVLKNLNKKTLIVAKIRGENKFLGLAVIIKEFDPKISLEVW